MQRINLIFLISLLFATVYSACNTDNLVSNFNFEKFDSLTGSYILSPWKYTVLFNDPHDGELYSYYVRQETPRNQAASLNTPGRTEVFQNVTLNPDKKYTLSFATAANDLCKSATKQATGYFGIGESLYSFTSTKTWEWVSYTFNVDKADNVIRFGSSTSGVDGDDIVESVCGPVIDDVLLTVSC
ncbi:hypothetical protein HK099_008678 [Clydaea vesicula]|uniref:DUF642 domain-containing protein n=1 Tax=Clydaea vesicula TaxID=447962 RepID=A0AAD5TZW2_9FUNG|nr:hypothetical protein HK099_008678 [Clydaea vesicula]KAJ3379905.1 hypothetical protein HDU92_006317 [Lobulomyces angularis]